MSLYICEHATQRLLNADSTLYSNADYLLFGSTPTEHNILRSMSDAQLYTEHIQQSQE